MRVAGWFVAAMLLQSAAADAPPVAQPSYMRYLRPLNVPQGTGQACAELDAQIFPHAAPSLIDLRVFPFAAGAPQAAGASASVAQNAGAGAATHEVPYAITLSETASEETAQARLLNIGTDVSGKKIVLDLEMPDRAYTDVKLDLDPTVHDFIATATIEGANELGSYVKITQLGSFTLFDLTAQRLSRSTTLLLPESTFHYLHIALAMADAPGARGSPGRFVPSIVQGAEVPPSREAQAIYTTVAEMSVVATQGRESVARFEVPARVPVERVEFVVSQGFKSNFSRDVRVTATAEAPAKGPADSVAGPVSEGESGGMEADQRPPQPEVVSGSILRVHATQAGHEINTDQLTVPAVLGANLQRAAKVEVAIENGDDQPLPIAAVKLEMRQRRLCFDAAATGSGPLALYYGDPTLSAPVYDYERLFAPAEKPLAVTLGPQLANPDFTPRPGAPLSFMDRHPEVLWIALIAAIAALGMVALRSSRSVGR